MRPRSRWRSVRARTSRLPRRLRVLARFGRASVSIIGIDAETGEATESPEGEGVVPYIALVPIAVTVDNIADTVIADEFRTIEEICTGDVAQTDFCQENG